MKCLICESFSFSHICKVCQKEFLSPSLYKRKVLGVDVFSFYMYDDVKDFLHTKHTDLGYYIYNIMAKNSFKLFAQNFTFPQQIASIAVDDDPNKLYSHTAILNRSLKTKTITPLNGKLRANNKVNYSGKSKAFRLAHPRDFNFKAFGFDTCIIVDDIVTTGTTLAEAITTCKQHNKEVLFCLTLAGVKN
jgi:competence protein ComFC